MSQITKREVMKKLRGRYQLAGKSYKSKLIKEAIQLFGYHPKAAVRALGGKRPEESVYRARMGRPQRYEPERLLPVLKEIWLKGQQPCGRRLAGMMAEWVPAYEAYYRQLDGGVREQLLSASSATLDRLLEPMRALGGKKAGGTKPGSMLRQEIPIRAVSHRVLAPWALMLSCQIFEPNESGSIEPGSFRPVFSWSLSFDQNLSLVNMLISL